MLTRRAAVIRGCIGGMIAEYGAGIEDCVRAEGF